MRIVKTKEDIIRALMVEARRREGATATSAHLEARSLWIAAEYQHQHEVDTAFESLDGVMLVLSGRPPLNLDNWAYDLAKAINADSTGPSSAFEEFIFEIHSDDLTEAQRN